MIQCNRGKTWGARCAHREKGYGNALRGGIEAASGKWIIMGDADESYDFSETDRFVKKLQEGFDLVMGCRLPSGGGNSCRARCRLHTVGSGTRSFREWHSICLLRLFTMSIAGCAGSHGNYNRLNLQCEGMEFATEMIIKASLHGARIAEIPITLIRTVADACTAPAHCS